MNNITDCRLLQLLEAGEIDWITKLYESGMLHTLAVDGYSMSKVTSFITLSGETVDVVRCDYGGILVDYYNNEPEILIFDLKSLSHSSKMTVRIIDVDYFNGLSYNEFTMLLRRMKIDYSLIAPFREDGMVYIRFCIKTKNMHFVFRRKDYDWHLTGIEYYFLSKSS